VHYVYLLKHKTESRFKIGRARDFYHRLAALQEKYFDLENSLCIELNSENKEIDIEKHLHYLFAEYRLELEEGIEEGGGTEYFDIKCFQHVLDHLNSSAKFRPEMKPIPLPNREIFVVPKTHEEICIMREAKIFLANAQGAAAREEAMAALARNPGFTLD